MREKILRNPQEPPAGAWQAISDELDLEESWEEISEELELDSVWDRIDSRLDRYREIVRFERTGQVFSVAAAVILLLGSIGMEAFLPDRPLELPKETVAEQVAEQTETPAGNETKDFPGHTGQPGSAGPEEGISTNIKYSTSRQGAVNRKASVAPNGKSYSATGKITGTAGEAKTALTGTEKEENFFSEGGKDLFRKNLPDPESRAYKRIISGTGQPALLSLDSLPVPEFYAHPEEMNVARLYPSFYIGGGTALKMSWLLNNKTLYAMERSSLVTAAPAYQTDWFLLYGIKLHDRLFLQADLYVKDVIGQEYKEYRNGQYGVVKDQLNYQSLGLNISKVRKQTGFGKHPTFSRVLGGIYGGRLQNAKEESFAGSVDKTHEYAQFHLGAVSGYEYDTFLGDHFILSYGLRGRLDLMNIFSGTDINPGAFRKTRAFSMDLSLSVRYMLKK